MKFLARIFRDVTSSLAELRHLKYLDLSGNLFQRSQILYFIGSLKQLSYLNLSDAEFIGIIPPHIRNLSNLKVLERVKFEEMTKAQKLDVGFNSTKAGTWCFT